MSRLTMRRTPGVTERQGESFSALVDATRSPVGSDAARGVPAPRLPTMKTPGHVALKSERKDQ